MAPSPTTPTSSVSTSGTSSTDSSPIEPRPNDFMPRPTSPPKPLTREQLMERDNHAIEFAKLQLREGDTLVRIKYPDDSTLYDSTGFEFKNKKLFRVHSAKLLATGSIWFKEHLGLGKDKYEQGRHQRRLGYVASRPLPPGITYALDLTPPDEGPEALDLVPALCCPRGICNWYSAENRCGVHHSMVGGKDEFTKPKPVPEDSPTEEFMHDDGISGDALSYVEELDPKVPSNATYIRDYNRVLESSRLEATIGVRKAKQFDPKAKNRALKVEEVPDYCPIRHRAGIERLLQIIEGKEPRLDSAPKVWTLLALAKYFDCTNVVIDRITIWMIAQPNCQFIEILPETSYKIGNDLQSRMIARSAFAILVSEEAMLIAAREPGSVYSTKPLTNRFGRVKEDLRNEDYIDSIWAAAYEFQARIQKEFEDLVSSDVPWLAQSAEYSKLMKFWAHLPDGRPEKDTLAQLMEDLKHYVRGRILSVLTKRLPGDYAKEATEHRRAESYLKRYSENFQDTYVSLTNREKIMTKYFWTMLRDISWSTTVETNVLHDYEDMDRGSTFFPNAQLAEQYSVKGVYMSNILTLKNRVNEDILQAALNTGFHDGHLPRSCYTYAQAFQKTQPSSYSTDEYEEDHPFDFWESDPVKTSPVETTSVEEENPFPDFDYSSMSGLGLPRGSNVIMINKEYLKASKTYGKFDTDKLWSKRLADVKAEYAFLGWTIPPHEFETIDDYFRAVTIERWEIIEPSLAYEPTPSTYGSNYARSLRESLVRDERRKRHIPPYFNTFPKLQEQSKPEELAERKRISKHEFSASEEYNLPRTKYRRLSDNDWYSLPKQRKRPEKSAMDPPPSSPSTLVKNFKIKKESSFEDDLLSNMTSNSGKVVVAPTTIHQQPIADSGLRQRHVDPETTAKNIRAFLDGTIKYYNLPLRQTATASSTSAEPLPNTTSKPHVSFGTSSSPSPTSPKPFSATVGSTSKTYGLPTTPRIPTDETNDHDSPFFNLLTFLSQTSTHIRSLAHTLLSNSDVDRTLTDTLLCLTDNEYKFLPLWAGGNEDGSGGVFEPDMPPAWLGAIGPGPAYHTGFSSTSRASTVTDGDFCDGGSEVDTSVAVENGYGSHVDRRRVVSDDGFGAGTGSEGTSLAFSFEEVVEDYGGGDFKGKGRAGERVVERVQEKVQGFDDDEVMHSTPKKEPMKMVDMMLDDDDFMMESGGEEDWE